jgi:hypothetical protein
VNTCGEPPARLTGAAASGARDTAMQKVANRDVRGFGWGIAHGAVTRRPPVSLDTMVPRNGGYAYDVGVWELSIVQGPFSVAPCQTLTTHSQLLHRCRRGAGRGGHQRLRAVLPGHGQCAARQGREGKRVRLRGLLQRTRRSAAVRTRLRGGASSDDTKLRIVTVRDLGWGDRSQGRFATPADFPRHDGSPYSHVHARRKSVGVVHRPRAIFCRPVPVPNDTIRNLFHRCRASAAAGLCPNRFPPPHVGRG